MGRRVPAKRLIPDTAERPSLMPEYKAYMMTKYRCENPNADRSNDYGGAWNPVLVYQLCRVLC